jgi:Ulp1 family protease
MEPTYEMDKSWYSTDIIEEYLSIITNQTKSFKNKIYAFNTDFLLKYKKCGFDGIKSWIKTNYQDNDLYLFPVCKSHHWTLTVADTHLDMTVHYDSMHLIDNDITNTINKFIRDWKLHSNMEHSNWLVISGSTPKQNNNYDCGPWILETAKHLMYNEPVSFKGEDMQMIRRRQKSEINKKTINLKKENTKVSKISKNKKKYNKHQRKTFNKKLKKNIAILNI